MALRRVLSFKKKIKCRRTATTSIADIRDIDPPKVGDFQIYRRQKLKVTRVWHNPGAGILVEYEGKGTDVGVCLAHYWFDKIQEEKDREDK